jgi:PAS domain S-box-containing protein
MFPPEFQVSPYAVPSGLAAVVAAGVAGVAWRNREVAGGRWLAVTLAAASVWSGATALQALSADLAWKVLFNKLSYAGVVTAPVALFAFAGTYAGYGRTLSRRRLLALAAVPAATLALVVTNEAHGVVWTAVAVVPGRALGLAFADLTVEHGPAFAGWLAYSYGLLGLSSGLLAWTALTAEDLYRDQAGAILLAVGVAWVSNALSVFDLAPAGFDVTPVAFVVSSAVLAVGVLRHRLLTVAPAARRVGRDEVIASMDDAVLILDDRDRVVDCNPAAAAVLDTAERAALGRSLSTIAPEVADRLASTADGGEVVRDVDGRQRHYDVVVSTVSAGEAVDGRVVTMRDVTERRQRRRELERYDRILNTVDDVVYALDDEERVVGVNDAAVERTGYDREQLLGSHLSLLLDDAGLARSREAVRSLRAGERSATVEVDLVTDDGERVHCENRLAPLPRGDDYRGTVCVLRDVTDRRRRTQQLDVLNRVLRHDLRNDLNVVVGNADLIERTADGPTADRARDIKDTATGLVALSEKVRRIERAAEAPGREVTDVAEAVRRRVAELRTEYPGATLDLEVPPEAWAHASGLLSVAVDNLVENAVEHGDGEPTVEVTVARGPEYVTVAVADDGPGIPETERAILDRERETPLEHASGVGLWIVTWIVDASGGRVEFTENEPRGSVVRLHFPIADPPADRDPDAEGDPPTDRGGDTSAAPERPGESADPRLEHDGGTEPEE